MPILLTAEFVITALCMILLALFATPIIMAANYASRKPKDWRHVTERFVNLGKS